MKNFRCTNVCPYSSVVAIPAQTIPPRPENTPGIPWRLCTPHVSCIPSRDAKNGCNKHNKCMLISELHFAVLFWFTVHVTVDHHISVSWANRKFLMYKKNKRLVLLLLALYLSIVFSSFFLFYCHFWTNKWTNEIACRSHARLTRVLSSFCDNCRRWTVSFLEMPCCFRIAHRPQCIQLLVFLLNVGGMYMILITW